jgi:hypothetical protein
MRAHVYLLHASQPLAVLQAGDCGKPGVFKNHLHAE